MENNVFRLENNVYNVHVILFLTPENVVIQGIRPKEHFYLLLFPCFGVYQI